MSNFAKNMYAFLFVMLAIAGVFGGLGWYIDKQFGGGVSIIVGAVLFGIVVTLSIVAITQMMNNRTHQSAGDDITAYAEAMAKVDAARQKVQIELHRKQRELQVNAAKGLLADKQSEVRREEWLWKEEQKRLAAEAAAAAAAEQEEATAQWWQVDADTNDFEEELR